MAYLGNPLLSAILLYSTLIGTTGGGLSRKMQSSPVNETISIFHPELNDRAILHQHHLCTQSTSAYVGQTARMYCCLARLDRNLSVSWIRKNDVVVLTHGTAVFTSDERVTAEEKNGIWSLVIRKVGHNDAGHYECQTNSEIKESVTVRVDIKETRALIKGPSEYIHSGSTLILSCTVYLGPRGPDKEYIHNAVIHWFHEQRLLDPDLERWRSKSNSEPKIMTTMEIGPNGIQGWLKILKVTPFDSGNYTCVPSYAIPAWTQIHVLPDASVAEYDGVSEVKLDTSSDAAANFQSCIPIFPIVAAILVTIVPQICVTTVQ